MSDESRVFTRAALEHTQGQARSTGEFLGAVADLTGPAGLSTLRLHHELLEPGRRSATPHRHSRREEVFFVEEGRPTLVVVPMGDAECDEPRATQLSPGDVVVIRAGGASGHTLENRTEETVRLLGVSSEIFGDEVTFVASASPANT